VGFYFLDGVKALRDLIGGHFVDLGGEESKERSMQLQGELIQTNNVRSPFICKCTLRTTSGSRGSSGIQLRMQVAADDPQVIEEIMSVIG
jgi:hypothetical protein